MIKVNKSSTILAICMTLLACKQPRTETHDKIQEPIEDLFLENQNRLDSLNKVKAEALSIRNNANMFWDTNRVFTFVLQETIEADKRPLSIVGTIKDIIKRSNRYVLKILCSNYNGLDACIAEINVPANRFRPFLKTLNPTTLNEGCFIVKVKSVNSYHPILQSEIEPSGDNVEDASSYLTLDFVGSMVKIEGDLMDYLIYEQISE